MMWVESYKNLRRFQGYDEYITRQFRYGSERIRRLATNIKSFPRIILGFEMDIFLRTCHLPRQVALYKELK